MQKLIDTAMPTYDAGIAERVVVHADPATVYRCARGLDFLTVRTPLLVASMWIRALPERLVGRAPAPVARFVVAEGSAPRGWLLVEERAGRELVFGAVGVFWRPAIVWRDVPRSEFREFGEPGWGKIAATFCVAPHERGAVLSYECRTATYDADSRRRFRRYWTVIRPFVRHVMRATLATIKRNAEDQPVA